MSDKLTVPGTTPTLIADLTCAANGSYTENYVRALCERAAEALSLESVRSEALEFRRLVKLLADLAITESEIEQEFKHGPRVIFEKSGQIAVRDVLMARRALQSPARVAEGEVWKECGHRECQMNYSCGWPDDCTVRKAKELARGDVHSTELRK